jgi:hypothetical protein
LLVGLVLVVVVSGVWVAATGALAARDLHKVQRDIAALQTAATGDPSDSARLAGLARTLQDDSERAESRTSDPVWRLWQHAPVVGASLRLTGGIAHQAHVLSRDVLPPLVAVAQDVPTLRAKDGTVDLAPLARQRAALQHATTVLSTARSVLRAYRSSWLSPLQDGRVRLLRELDRLQGRLDGVVAASVAGPGMIGSDGPRRYLIAVQNNAEARAGGGIVSAYGVLQITRGRASLERFGADTDLRPVSAPVVDLGAEWSRRYARLGAGQDWREVTATPDFPTAATVMLALWSATHAGDKLDGVLSIDPVGLADVLRATGPVLIPAGRQLTADSFVPFTLSEVYGLYPDKDQRSAVLTAAAKSVFEALVSGAGTPARLAERLGHAALQRHLQVFSAHPVEERALGGTSVAGALPRAAAPLLSVITQDAGASKLSYYLRREITYDGALSTERQDFGDGRGPVPQELATVTVKLTNTAPASGLPPYVTLREDAARPARRPAGQINVSFSLYLGRLGQLDEVKRDGQRIAMNSETELGLSVFTAALTLDPGQSSTFVLRVRQPTRPGSSLVVVPQPVVFPDRFLVRQRDIQ